MRTGLLFLITALPLGSGCAAYIAGSGKDLSGLTTREQVHAEFGIPVATGTDGQEYEEFHTRRKIAEPVRAHGLKLASGMSFGAFDLIAFPVEVVTQAVRPIGGSTLRFWYDTEGRVRAIDLDGADVRGMYFPKPVSDPSNGQQQP